MPFSPLANTITVGGVICTVAPEGDGWAIRESQPESGPKIEIDYVCDFAQRYNLVRALRGTSTFAGGQIFRTIPHQCPLSTNLYCTDVNQLQWIKPTWTGTLPTADRVIVPAVYSMPTWLFAQTNPDSSNKDPSGLPFTETTIQIAADVFMPPKGAYFWPSKGSGEAVPDSSIGIVRPRAQITMKRKFMPYTPLHEGLLGVGTVNLFPIKIGNHTFPKGYVLFVGINTTPTTDPVGNQCWDWEYVFTGNRDSEWNASMASDGAYYVMNTKKDGTGNPPFAYLDYYTSLP